MAKKPLDVEALRHDAARRKNIPTAEFESVMREDEKSPIRLAYERRNRDLDPQLVWRGKDEQDWSDLIVQAPPLYIQEKVHPKVIIDDLRRESKLRAERAAPPAPDLFADFNGLRDKEAATEFYQHDQRWSNRMISGDSLSVMASLAEREGLRGKVQCIYFDPPYGIKFNSNFQWSTATTKVADGKVDQITREPEQVRAFRDTWCDGVHSYLTYLRDRLTVARDLLHESGSIFIQIGEDNSHLVRAILDEVFDSRNFMSQIAFRKTSGKGGAFLDNVFDQLLWYSKDRSQTKFRKIFNVRSSDTLDAQYSMLWDGLSSARRMKKDDISDEELARERFKADGLFSESGGSTTKFDVPLMGREYKLPGKWFWKTNLNGMSRLEKAQRLVGVGNTLCYRRMASDFPVVSINDYWVDTMRSGFGEERVYVVQTGIRVIERCLLLTTDPGDLVLDPTCGSGSTAYVAEQWGRRWITIDTSRVAIALARSRLMGARYPYYLLADSAEGQQKEAEITRTPRKTTLTRGDIRLGFVFERVPHITLKSIATNAEIEVIWDKWQNTLEPLRASLNAATGQTWEEWEVPRESASGWPAQIKEIHLRWWQARIARQKEIDASIAAKAEFEYLYDKPYIDNTRVRVAGPFTVESLSPHRTLAVDWNDELIDNLDAKDGHRAPPSRDDVAADFTQMILENLRAAGVQQAHKEGRITFTGLTGWPGHFICAEARFMEGEQPRRAGIFVGPEFGTVSRPDLVWKTACKTFQIPGVNSVQ
jgi:adenine-specific DNA-methyltransferase